MVKKDTHHTDNGKIAMYPNVQHTSRRFAPLSLLFARYVAGQIDEASWYRLMRVLDARDTSPQIRLALATFINDALTDLEPNAVVLPKSSEVRELLTEVHAAACEAA